MAHLTRPAEISGVSAGSFPETAAGNRAYQNIDKNKLIQHAPQNINTLKKAVL